MHRLHRIANQRKSVLDAVHAVYMGLFQMFVDTWKKEPRRTIGEWDDTRKQLREYAKAHPAELADLVSVK